MSIPRYEDQAFDDMSEESQKIKFERFIIQKPLRPVPSSIAVPYKPAQMARQQKGKPQSTPKFTFKWSSLKVEN